MTFTLTASTWTPLTNDLATGVTTFLSSASDESGSMTIFDNTVGKVQMALVSYNTETTDQDTKMAELMTYASDAYSIDMTFTWLASEVAATNSVGWCMEATALGASCWLLTKDGDGAYTADNESYWIATADFSTASDDKWNVASTAIDVSADGTRGFNGSWYCGSVSFPSDATESVICSRYQPQPADSYTSDYRFAPASESLNPNAAVVNIHSYFSSRGTGAHYSSENTVTLNGAAYLAVAASTAALLVLIN